MKYLLIILLCCISSVLYSQSNLEIYGQKIKQAENFVSEKKYRKAGEQYSEAFSLMGKGLVEDRYNAACAWALAGEKEKAFFELSKAIINGKFDNYRHIMTDPDLISLYGDPRWSALVDMVHTHSEEKIIDGNIAIIRSLDSMYISDQGPRKLLLKYEEKQGSSAEVTQIKKIIKKSDSINIIKLSNILNTYGWLGPEEIGPDGSNTIFLVLQHADLRMQKKYLPLLKDAVKQKKAAAAYQGMLEDRIRVREGKWQLYGTQLHRDKKTGKLYLCPIEDVDNVDARRAAIGLPNMAAYLHEFGLEWAPQIFKKNIEKLPPCIMD